MKGNSIHTADVLYPELSYSIIGAAMDVHNSLNPGWDEWDYHRAMISALKAREHRVDSHGRKELTYRDRMIDGFKTNNACVAPEFNGQRFEEREVNALSINKDLIISVSASSSATDLCYLKTYMKYANIEHGVLVNLGHSKIQLRGVL